MSRTKKKEGAVRGTWLSDDFISTVYDSDHCI